MSNTPSNTKLELSINDDGSINTDALNVERRQGPADPLAGIWEQDAVPLLQSCPTLSAVTVYEELLRLHPLLDPKVKRTVQRRVRLFKIKNGKERDVIFAQTKVPGRLGISDFTDMESVGVTVNGVAFPHLLYHFRLAWSGFTHARVIIGGESFIGLSEGLQDGLKILGGIPEEHRTDSLSAAFCNLNRRAVEDLTTRYQELISDLGMIPSRNTRGRARENGSIESAHRHLKQRIKNALSLRNSSDFSSLPDYRKFIAEIVANINVRKSRLIDEERTHLRPLPTHRSADYEEHKVKVTSYGGITLKRVFYTVPSSYIGSFVRVRLYDDRLEVYLEGKRQLTLARGFPSQGGLRGYMINYRHVLPSLRARPRALLELNYRDQLFPRESYRHMFDLALKTLSKWNACRLMVDILSLAHERCCEKALGDELAVLWSMEQVADITQLRKQFATEEGELPTISIQLPSLSTYDQVTGLTFHGDENKEDCA